MAESRSKLERKSALYLKIVIGDIFQALAGDFGGETTINHLRIGHYIGLQSLYNGQPTSNKDIAETLDIPRSTVSRIVADFIDKGWVTEQLDPEDGRRKQLVIPTDHPLADNFERDFRRLIKELLNNVESGKIVPVDSDTEAY